MFANFNNAFENKRYTGRKISLKKPNFIALTDAMKHLYCLILLLSGVISNSLSAQAPLPVGMAPGELQAMPAYLQQPRVAGITTPPPAPM